MQLTITAPKRNIQSYAATTQGTISTTTSTSTTTSIFRMWHAIDNSKRIEIYRIIASVGAGVGSTAWFTLRGNFVTLEAFTPGGTIITPAILDRDDPASSMTGTSFVRSGPTAAPLIRQNDSFTESINGTISTTGLQMTLFDIVSARAPIVLRANLQEGFEIRSVTSSVALTTAAQVAVSVFWTET